MPKGRYTRWTLPVVLLLCFIALLIPDRNSLHSMHETNSSARFYQLQSLSDEGSLSIESSLCRWSERSSTLDVSLDETGRIYPNKSPGLLFLSYPVFKVMYEALPNGFVPMHWLLNVLGILFSLIPMVLAVGWLTAWMQKASPGSLALLIPGVVLLSTPLVVYTGLFQDYGLATALLLAGIILVFRERGLTFDALAGLAFGFAGAVNYMYFFHGAAAVLLILGTQGFTLRRFTERLLPMVLGGLLPLGMVLSYHTWIWGDPFSTPYDHLMFSSLREGKELTSFTFEGFWSSLFHPKLGILFFLPWGVFGIAGLVMTCREKSPLGVMARVGLGITFVGLAFSAYWTPTNPDGAAFNRHLTPLFPFFALGLVMLVGHVAQRRNVLDGVVGLAAGGLVVSALYAWVTTWSFPYHPSIFYSPVWEMSFPLFVSGAHVAPLHLDPRQVAGAGDVNGNWGLILLTIVLTGAVFFHALRQRQIPRARLVRRTLYALLTVTFLLGAGITTDPISNEDRLAGGAKAEMQRRALDEKFSIVKESYWVPDGWGWKWSGHQKNPLCHVPWGGENP